MIMQSAAYDADCHLPREAVEILVAEGSCNILIISVSVSEEDRRALVKAAPDRTGLFN